MFKGRSVETKKNLIRLLFERAQRELDLASANLEVTITKTPKQNWGVVVNPETKSPPTTKSRSRTYPKVYVSRQFPRKLT
jgi:phenylpyruvate tautomerase PptA (4-oxalocrotonate tautomerase family)